MFPIVPTLLILVGPQVVQFQRQTSGTQARLRGVSAVSSQVAWASGTGGTVLRTVDGGRTWHQLAVPDTAKLDFRDIEAFSAEEATVLSIGPGAASRIYRTLDGGRTWVLQYVNPEAKAFYNALAFTSPKRGWAMSDPVEGRFRILRTEDAGRTWQVDATPMPEALKDEGAFAASGTCLVASTEGMLFATGGAGKGRVFRLGSEVAWRSVGTDMEAPNASSGIFGLAVSGGFAAAVGGDYRQEGQPSRFLWSKDGGRSWTSPATLRGFRSGVAFFSKGSTLWTVVVGPKGCDLSRDGGRTWEPLSDHGFHAISAAGGTAWAVGEDGAIGRFTCAEGVRDIAATLKER